MCSFLYQASSFKAAQYKLVTKISSGRKSSEIKKGKIDFLSSLLDWNIITYHNHIINCSNKLILFDYMCLNFEIIKEI